jgi:outer membrane protein assembly factor BamB
MFQNDPCHLADGSSSSINTESVQRVQPRWFFPTQNQVSAEATVDPDTVYVGDADGKFYAIKRAQSGQATAKWTYNVLSNTTTSSDGSSTGSSLCSADAHKPSYGEITSTAAVVPSLGVVYFGGGGSVFALNSKDGTCLWSHNLDPNAANSGSEVESSPVFDAKTDTIIVGSDANEGTGMGKPGLWAFDASSGLLKWKFEVEEAKVITNSSLAYSTGTDGCGDVWSSPALDASGVNGDGLVVFGVANCNNPPTSPANSHVLLQSGIFAIDATTGAFQWEFTDDGVNGPSDNYNNPASGADDDFGASPIIDSSAGLVLAGGKNSYAYGLLENPDCLAVSCYQGGASVKWSRQVSQAGNYGQGPGAIGGFIGSPALGQACPPQVLGGACKTALFLTSAIFGPFTGDGVQPTVPPANPDASLVCVPNPQDLSNSVGCQLRAASVHAVDALTGDTIWQQPLSTPDYAPATYANGVVFAPSTTSFSAIAYDAGTGSPLWAFPNAAADSGGVSIAGSDIVFGGGTIEGSTPSGQPLPPQNFGVWDFSVPGS